MHEHNSSESVARTLARIRLLQTTRRRRDSGGQFWIEGIRQFVQAVDAGFEFDLIVHNRMLLKCSLAEKLIRRLAARGVRRVHVSPEQFRSICTTERASGIGAIVRQRWKPLEQIDPQKGLCWLVVESLRSPGNLGTILRTAEATGVGGVIFLGMRCDAFHPAVVRASMGGIFHLTFARTSPRRLRQWARSRGVRIAGLSPTAPLLWTDVPVDSTVALLIGEERQGLSQAAKELCDMMVRLPMTGRADSLNVAIAAGVTMYELVRRGRRDWLPGDGAIISHLDRIAKWPRRAFDDRGCI